MIQIVLFFWTMVNRFGQLVMGVLRIRSQPVFINNAWSVKEKGKRVRYWLHLFRKEMGKEIVSSEIEEKAQNGPSLPK